MLKNITGKEALERLKAGNKKYVDNNVYQGDVSPRKRRNTFINGQTPYVVIISCSDSRVIPEVIFSAGLGELFTIRIAGNVIDKHQLGTIEYAVSHLGASLVVMMGHTHCGAVTAALTGHSNGYIQYVVDDIQAAIQGETDIDKACEKNVRYGVKLIQEALNHIEETVLTEVQVVGAVYDIETGHVHWLDN